MPHLLRLTQGRQDVAWEPVECTLAEKCLRLLRGIWTEWRWLWRGVGLCLCGVTACGHLRSGTRDVLQRVGSRHQLFLGARCQSAAAAPKSGQCEPNADRHARNPHHDSSFLETLAIIGLAKSCPNCLPATVEVHSRQHGYALIRARLCTCAPNVLLVSLWMLARSCAYHASIMHVRVPCREAGYS
jgi:hypothetical protein